MKLILTILLLTTIIFASKIKEINYKPNKYAYLGTNHIIPEGQYPKKKESVIFIITKGNEGNLLINKKNKKAWKVGIRTATLPAYMQTYRNYCTTRPIDKNTLKSLDLNLVEYILKKRYSTKEDISIFVKMKKGEDNNPKNFSIFSLTQNKYLNIPTKAYSICEKDYTSSIKFHNELLDLHKKEQKEQKYKKTNAQKQEKINIQKRKTIQVADDTDQGMILEIKGPLVLIQKETCTIMDDSGYCMNYGKTTEWIKRKKLTFSKQKD